MTINHPITRLCLPEIDPSLRVFNDILQIFDPVRCKYVALTPEEWVRQNFVSFLINNRSVPQGRIANEVAMRQNGCQRRCDSVIYDGSAAPIAICEYKAPSVPITEKVFDQIFRYNMQLGVGLLIVSNGLRHFCCSIDSANAGYAFLADIPHYPNMLTKNA